MNLTTKRETLTTHPIALIQSFSNVFRQFLKYGIMQIVACEVGYTLSMHISEFKRNACKELRMFLPKTLRGMK